MSTFRKYMSPIMAFNCLNIPFASGVKTIPCAGHGKKDKVSKLTRLLDRDREYVFYSASFDLINLISTIHLILLKMSKIKERLPDG